MVLFTDGIETRCKSSTTKAHQLSRDVCELSDAGTGLLEADEST